jgi:hypothetical protein
VPAHSRAVEREFGRLKNEWALAPLRVRRIERVRLHADLTILAKLACALNRALIDQDAAKECSASIKKSPRLLRASR